MFGMPTTAPRPLDAVGFQLETTTSLGSGESVGRVIFEQRDGGRVRCTLRDDDVAYLDDLGRQVMAGARIEKLQAEHSALWRFVEAAFPGLKLVEAEVEGKPVFSLQWRQG